MKRKPWQRLALSLVGTTVIATMWRWATLHLYALPQQSIAAFTTITTHALYAISAIVIFMVTGRLIYDWKNESASKTIELGQQIVGRRLEPKDIDDGAVD